MLNLGVSGGCLPVALRVQTTYSCWFRLSFSVCLYRLLPLSVMHLPCCFIVQYLSVDATVVSVPRSAASLLYPGQPHCRVSTLLWCFRALCPGFSLCLSVSVRPLCHPHVTPDGQEFSLPACGFCSLGSSGRHLLCWVFSFLRYFGKAKNLGVMMYIQPFTFLLHPFANAKKMSTAVFLSLLEHLLSKSGGDRTFIHQFIECQSEYKSIHHVCFQKIKRNPTQKHTTHRKKWIRTSLSLLFNISVVAEIFKAQDCGI